MPAWVRYIFLEILPKILLMREPREPLRTAEIQWPPDFSDTSFYANQKFSNRHKTSFVEFSEEFLTQRRNPSNNNQSTLTRNKEIDKGCSKKNVSPQISRAIEGITYVCEHLRKEDQEKKVRPIFK